MNDEDELRTRLYEAAVQTPDRDVETFDRLFRRLSNRSPFTLREDFCGSALLSARWVESDDDREALAVDRDPAVLVHARAHRRALGDDADRMRIVRRDVRTKSERSFDVVSAMNFSWALLDDRELRAYFGSVHACLEDDGLFVLELFGGAQMKEVVTRRHPADGFTYVWEQRAFDGRVLEAAIHFETVDRTLRDAFTYRFVLRPVHQVRAWLAEAGFTRSFLFVEDARGRYVERVAEPKRELFRALLVASR